MGADADVGVDLEADVGVGAVASRRTGVDSVGAPISGLRWTAGREG
ncbi:hypothetical protein [Streptomyces sp. NPDC048611]